ncbi:MAG: hypothetical protein ACF8SC_11435 [Phycisphaerales bacterium JB037]
MTGRMMRMMRGHDRVALVIAALLGVAVLSTGARAQESDDEVVRLRREVARLREALADADARARRIEQRNAELEAMVNQARDTIRDLRRALEEVPASTEPTLAMAPVPADPHASAWSMLAELQRRYRTAFGDRATPTTEAGYEQMLGEIERWTVTTNRELTGQPTWLVKVIRLTERAPGQRERRAIVSVMDEELMQPIGSGVSVVISREFERAIERAEETGRFELWRVETTFAPGLVFNEGRESVGAFNVPPFVGKFVEFSPRIEVRRFVGVAEPTDEDAGGANEGGER